jgi:peptidylprolyl isomerase
VELLAVNDAPPESPPEVDGEEQEREGVRFVDIVEGSGDEVADGDSAFVHYTGWLEADGKRFDSSLIEPAVYPYNVGAGSTIPGWDIGVPGMKAGGARRLIIPPELAYGAEGAGNGVIPPDATLIFDIELVEIVD